MARRRMMDPEFFDDKEFFLQIFSACFELFPSKSHKFLYRIGRTVRLFYAGLWKYCDDCGRFLEDYVKVKAEIFPFDEDVSLLDIGKFLKVLQKANKVYRYEINGVAYGIIVKFLKHQRIDKPTPSKLPTPPEPKFQEWLQSNSLNHPRGTLAQEKLSIKEEKRKEVKETEPSFSSSSQIQNQDENPFNKLQNQIKTKTVGEGEKTQTQSIRMDDIKKQLKDKLSREPTYPETMEAIKNWKLNEHTENL